MNETTDAARRRLLKNAAIGTVLLPLAFSRAGTAFAAAAPLLAATDPVAKSLNYTEDATKSATAKKGSHCGNCALYQGAAGSTEGGCAIFAGKDVKATGVCDSWSPKA